VLSAPQHFRTCCQATLQSRRCKIATNDRPAQWREHRSCSRALASVRRDRTPLQHAELRSTGRRRHAAHRGVMRRGAGWGRGRMHQHGRTHAPQKSHKPNSRPTASLCHARHCELCPTTSFKRNATHFRDADMATGGALATHARFPPLGCGAERSESRLAPSSGGGTWNLELCISCSRFFWPKEGFPSEAECGSSVRSCGA
jgi:hypothetical protein